MVFQGVFEITDRLMSTAKVSVRRCLSSFISDGFGNIEM